MAKGIRSKVKKRFRTAKRDLVNATVEKKRLATCKKAYELCSQGLSNEVIPKLTKNAFLYPDDKDAQFPKVNIVKPLDFRSSALPGAGYATVGGRRKFTAEEKAQRQIVGIEGKGSWRGKTVGEVGAKDGDDDDMDFVEDTEPVRIENDPVRAEARRLKAQGANINYAPIVPTKPTKSSRKGGQRCRIR